MKDFFENAPDIVIDKILEKLPIRVGAQTSVLSKKWRHAWLSLERLIFDSDFQEQQKNEDGSCNWRKSSRIVSKILLHHNGPVRSFDLHVPEDADEDHMNLSQWISFLSKNRVQMITITHWNCEVLKSIAMRLRKMPEILVTVKIADAINLLASSCQLQYIQFDGHLLKLFAAGGLIRSSSVKFNHLRELCLAYISLSKLGVLRDVVSMIKCGTEIG